MKTASGEEYAVVTDWWEMLLNHSSLTHCIHVLFSTWLAGAFLIMSISSYYLLKKRHQEFAIKSMQVALVIATFSVFAQLASADHLARNVATHNPEKFASFEGVYETKPYTGIYAFGWVDSKEQKVHGLGVPGMLSFLVHRDFAEPVKGLDQFPKEEWPNVPLVFQVYHLMIGMWVLMVVATFIGLFMWWRKSWMAHPLLMKFIVISVAFPQLASLAGWYAAEFGRQPWTVYKLLRTNQAYSGGVTFDQALLSLSLIVILYLTFFILFLVLLDKKIKHGPTDLFEEAPYRDPYKQH